MNASRAGGPRNRRFGAAPGIRAALGLVLPLMLTWTAAASTPGDWLRDQLATAPPGATIHVPAGTYDGPFVLTQSVRLIGVPGAILQGDRATHVVAIRAPDVELAGFTIRGSGRSLAEDHAAVHVTGPRAHIHDNRIVDSLHGIYVRKADGCRIEANVIRGAAPATPGAVGIADPVTTGGLRLGDVELCGDGLAQDRRGNGIHLWNSAGHTITGNTITDTRDGIYFSFTDRTLVRNNIFRRVRYGLHYMYSDENTFVGNVFTESAAGAALMYSKNLELRANRFHANRSQRAYGLLLQSVDNTRILDNEITGNTLGLFLENTNGCTISGNRLHGNHVALRLTDSSSGNRLFANTFAGNIHPVETSGRNGANTWAVAGRGNHWDGALALDLDRDGIADVPHRETDLFGAWRRSFPAIGLLSASPGERLLRFVHNRLALPGVPGVTDPRPLVTAPARQRTMFAAAAPIDAASAAVSSPASPAP